MSLLVPETIGGGIASGIGCISGGGSVVMIVRF